MDDPHIQWLQMACAIWGGICNLVFFRTEEALGCAALWSLKSKIFLPLFGAPVAQETPQKWLKSSMHWNLLCIWIGNSYISEAVGFVVLANHKWK